ncbi:hypothetical protein Patl1_06543 [Pistacia atlantica]|uniref:Uncharacterized protein n=1 Tax=Pistacia atlantica TaxID=434234 RepID=A0ACC1BU64_9ROSI|nr:hypothetical protein Patl1_06543 [Pistacia atlantica]
MKYITATYTFAMRNIVPCFDIYNGLHFRSRKYFGTGCGTEGLRGFPEISLGRPYSNMINRDVLRDDELGKFVEMMVGMLPEDLAFTVFVPSEKAFERDLRLRVNHDLEDAMLVVNRVKSERVDLKKGKIVVHIMDGVIMDADFEQSVLPDNNEEDE